MAWLVALKPLVIQTHYLIHFKALFYEIGYSIIMDGFQPIIFDNFFYKIKNFVNCNFGEKVI